MQDFHEERAKESGTSRPQRLDPPDGVISKQKDQRADERGEVTNEVEPVYARGTEGIVQPAAGKGAGNLPAGC